MNFSKKITFAFILCAFAVGYVTSCSISVDNSIDTQNKPSEGKEIASAVSSDQTFKAIVWRPTLDGGLGATISQPYQVWIEVIKGKGDGELKSRLVFAAEKTDGLLIKWTAPLVLEICYSEAQIYDLFNRFNDIVGKPRNHEMNIDTKEGEVILRKVKRISDC
jgi:hypothetical protein